MGLDLVELVMRVEEEYGIEIGDDEAAQLETCGQLHQFLLGKLNIQPSERCLSSATFYRMRRSLVELSGQSRCEISPQTPMNQLLPLRQRRANWQQLKERSHLNLPDLELPELLHLTIFVGFGALWLTSLGCAIGNAPLWSGLFFFGGIGYLSLIWKITKPFAICFPDSCRSVGSATKTAMFSSLPSVSPEPVSMKTEELWQSLQAIIADELSVPLEKVTLDAHFIRDLGAG
jgi:hypothetical protein